MRGHGSSKKKGGVDGAEGTQTLDTVVLIVVVSGPTYSLELR